MMTRRQPNHTIPARPDPDPRGAPGKGAETRRRIAEGALELFTERGYHGTSIPLIARRAGIAEGTIYRHFESKEELVNAIFREWHEQGENHIFGDWPAGLSPREEFGLLFRRLMDFAVKHPVPMAFLTLHFHSPYLNDASRECVNHGRQRAFALYRRATQAGAAKDLPPKVLYFVVDGIATGLFRAHFAEVVKLTPKLIEELEECTWEAIRR